MIRSMFAAVTSLRNHQTFMDTVANNIANVNTTGFKAGRLDFQDVLNQSLRGAVAPSTGLLAQGWQGDETGAIDTGQPIGDLNIPFNRMSPPTPSTSVSIAGNLDSRAPDGTTVETVMTTFDSLGQPHNITMTFVKVPNANAWDWEAS